MEKPVISLKLECVSEVNGFCIHWRDVIPSEDIEKIRRYIAENHGVEPDQVHVYLREEYEEIMEERLKETYNIPDKIIYYFDVEKMVDDMITGGDVLSYKFKAISEHGYEHEIEIIAEIEW